MNAFERRDIRALVGALLALAVVCAAGGSARADRLVLDRVIAEPSYFPDRARVRAFVSPLTLEGRMIQDGEPYELVAGGDRLSTPYLESQFAGSDVDLAVAIVIETDFDYDADLPAIQREMASLVGELPRRARVAVVAYGGRVEGGHRLLSPNEARGQIGSLFADSAPEEPRLIEAGERALGTLERAFTDSENPRRIMVLVSDGRDIDPRPERYRDLGLRAADEDIRIHSIAYSPVDNRRPLLGLGELSRRSGGTFRWVRDVHGLSSHVDHLREEILEQPVLTFFPPRDDVENARLAIARGDEVSDTLRIRELTCGGEACDGDRFCAAGMCVARDRDGGAGLLGWILRVAGVLAVAFVVLFVIGFVLTRRQEAVQAPAQADGAQGAASGAQVIAPQPPSGSVTAQPPPSGGVTAQPPPGAAPPAAPQAGGRGAPQARTGATPATLFVASGPHQGKRLALRHGFTIGKGKRCDLRLPADPHVGEHHAQFLLDAAGAYAVVDQGSPGGTFVNGVRATQMRLSHGASIRIGNTEVKFLSS